MRDAPPNTLERTQSSVFARYGSNLELQRLCSALLAFSRTLMACVLFCIQAHHPSFVLKLEFYFSRSRQAFNLSLIPTASQILEFANHAMCICPSPSSLLSATLPYP